MHYNEPNLFIVGAAKSGTTTLYAYLEKHPQVFMPQDELYKEPAFFSKKGKKVSYENYINIFKDANKAHKYIGEASTAYLTDESSAIRIYKYKNSAKIIIILRNPITRAYSLYNWMVQEGYEYAISFKKALELEQKRKDKVIPNFFEPEYYWNYMYVKSGLYYEQVKRYLNLFEKNNVFIIIFEEMILNKKNVFKEVSTFLDIRYEEHIQISHENVSKQVYNPILSFLARKINNSINKLRSQPIRKKSDRDKILYLLQKNKKPDKINIKTQYDLMRYYLTDIEKLEKLINKDLSVWKEL